LTGYLKIVYFRPVLNEIIQKVYENQRLDFEDGIKLFETDDIYTLAELANFVQQKKNKNFAYYIKNIHLNYSNICINLCPMCAYGKSQNDKKAWQWRIEDAINYVKRFSPEGLSEIHIVGGINPEYPYNFYIDLLKNLKKGFKNTVLKAYTAVEIDFMSKISKKSIKDVLEELKDAGLDMIPGGGADIFSEDIRKQICPKKITPQRYLEIHKTAHQLAIKTNCTMLYGHIETIEDRVNHLLKLRELQDETGGFVCFVPLAFQPKNTKFNHLHQTTAITDIKVHAIARLLLDNFDHIKTYWVMVGLKMAQVLLNFGADDLDGTIVSEKIAHMAGALSPEGISESDLVKLIHSAGKIAICRDAFYNPLSA
jgi:aminodeoxyfutalosine synthase